MSISERWNKFPEMPPNVKQKLMYLGPLFEEKGVLLAYLFGSLSQGREGQDVDLAILTRNVPAFRLRPVISDCLGTARLDLVDLRNASPVLRFEILRTGQLLYAADEMSRERFELTTLHLYRDTRPLRRQQESYLRERIHTRWSSSTRSSSNV